MMADLYIPPKPAIIRATELPRSPAEARGIAMREAFGPAPVFMAAGAMGRKGKADPFSVTRVHTASDAAAASNTKTFMDCVFGDAASSRELLCALTWWDNDVQDGAFDVALTIGGVSASEVHKNGLGLSGFTIGGGVYRAAVPSGTTGSVAITLTNFSGTMDGFNISLYRVTGAPSLALLDTIDFSNVTSLGTLDTADGGFSIVLGNRANGTPTISPDTVEFNSGSAGEHFSHILHSGQSAGTQAYTASVQLFGTGLSFSI